jgi:acyl carrier protein
MSKHAEIRQFVVENFLFGQTDKQISDDQSFLESGIIDSTGVLELIGFLESNYAISIADDELVPANLDSVDRVASFVDGKLKTKAASVA